MFSPTQGRISSDSNDPDRMLYSGSFFSPADRHLMNKILRIAPADLGRHLWSFQDERLQLMLFRYRARNYPETLSQEESRILGTGHSGRDWSKPWIPTISHWDRTGRSSHELREERKDEVESLQNPGQTGCLGDRIGH